MSKSNVIRNVAFVGDYLPRRCGIATFTYDLHHSFATQFPRTKTLVVSVNDKEGSYKYPDEVRYEISEQNINDYRRVADFLNFSNFDVVSLQHEFGIYGGAEGSHILSLLRDLHIPVVTTLHTVLRDPNPNQRKLMEELTSLSSRLIVMAEKGREFLKEVYHVPEEKIDVIPHGIPDMPFVDPNFYKDKFGVEGKYVVLTFGLLSPNKGIEYVLRALPQVVKEVPNLGYIVLGATHPKLVRKEGEAYRLHLKKLVKDLGIEKHVIFYNSFVELEELKEFLGAADIYITPYLNPAQITSGTLSYAFGCGKAVISTPYWHAEELLSDERGVLVPFADEQAIARELISLLQDEPRRHAMRKRAYMLGRKMVWANVARLYADSFYKARQSHLGKMVKPFIVPAPEKRADNLPTIRLDHLVRMTDSTGLLQHARYSIPNFADGYCTDDNARALLLTTLLEEAGFSNTEVQNLALRYAAFLNHAFNPDKKCFRNFMSYTREWMEECGSGDSHGRALWALGAVVGRSKQPTMQMWATQLFEQALPIVLNFTSPRSWAFSLMGIHEYCRRLGRDRWVNQLRATLTRRLVSLYEAHSTKDWLWFEDILTYDNAILPHAVIRSGYEMENGTILEIGLTALRWLAGVQTAEAGHFRPIGSDGFYRRGETRALFDQQPLEAYSMTTAALEAYRITHDDYWYEQARKAFEWFLGRNDLGRALYNPSTGGCRDALQIDRLNLNQGAESTLAFLLSLTEMYLAENAVVSEDKQSEAANMASVLLEEKRGIEEGIPLYAAPFDEHRE